VCQEVIVKSFKLPQQKRLVDALLDNIIQTASKADTSLLEDLFASLDARQTFVEDRIREFKHADRTIPDQPTLGCRNAGERVLERLA
jgi:hypothetical protein